MKSDMCKLYIRKTYLDALRSNITTAVKVGHSVFAIGTRGSAGYAAYAPSPTGKMKRCHNFKMKNDRLRVADMLQ